ncbi:unnamed protein product, partial [Medioppia subpectinata]
MPWVAYIEVKKDYGLLLPTDTCPTCVSVKIIVYPAVFSISNKGKGVQAARYLYPPQYLIDPNAYDIAMVKLKTPLDLRPTIGSTHRQINSICLPHSDVYHVWLEYAIIAGFGMTSDNHLGNRLKFGWTVIQDPTYDANDRNGSYITSTTGSIGCGM